MKDEVHESLALADALSLIPSPKKKSVQAYINMYVYIYVYMHIYGLRKTIKKQKQKLEAVKIIYMK